MKNLELFNEYFTEKIIESVILTDEYKKYLDIFFINNKKLFYEIKNIFGIEYILSKIDVKLSMIYTLSVNNSDEFQMETFLRKDYCDIIIHINENILNEKIKKLDVFIEEIKNYIIHEFIHIEQWCRGKYLHPIKTNAIKFNEIRNKFDNSLISKDEYINKYLDEPYELMSVASTIVYKDIYINKTNKQNIIEMLKSGEHSFFSNYNIDKKKKIKIINYMIQYLEIYK